MGGRAGRRRCACVQHNAGSRARTVSSGAGDLLAFKAHELERSARIDLRAIHHVLFIGIVVNTRRQGRLRAIADCWYAQISPAPGIAAWKANNVTWLAAAHDFSRGGEFPYQR